MTRPRLTATQARQLAAGVLGIDPRTDIDTARAAYRRMAARHHPDAGGDHDAFLTVHTAWEVWRELSGADLADSMTPWRPDRRHGAPPTPRIVDAHRTGRRADADAFTRGLLVDVVA